MEQVESMDVEVSPEEEDRLLREDSPPIADYDFRTVPGPDVSGCPVAKLQVIKRPPVPCSDTAAGKDELTRTRSPVRFPSPKPRHESRRADRSTTSGATGKSTKQMTPRSPSYRSSHKRSPRRRSRSPMKSAQKKRRLSPKSKARPSVPERRFDERPRPYVSERRFDERRRPPPVSERRFIERPRPRTPERKVERPLRTSRSATTRPSSAVSSTPQKPAVDRVDQCPVSGCFTDITRSHAATHLPGIFDDHLEPTEELLRRRISVLRICESRLLGTVNNLAGLVQFVNDLRQIMRGHYHVSKQQARAMTAMCQLQGEEVPTEFTVTPANSSAVLLHWRVLVVLFACLNDPDRLELIDRYPVSATWIGDLPEGFDSHFHLDRSRWSLGAPEASVEDLCRMIKPDRDHSVRLTGGVAVFCDPGTYPSEEEMQHLRSQGYAVAIGLHPKRVDSYTDEDYRAFEEHVTRPEVAALGEVGLDYTANQSMWGQQHVALDRALKHLQPSQVLVLHARGAYYQLLFQLKGVVRPEQEIHLHCFEGDRQLMTDWLKEFPNTYFGFTGLVQHFNEAQRTALRNVPEDRLLVETDSPYFKIEGRKHSSPGLVGMVAGMMADVRGSTWKEILKVASSNARRLYKV